MASASMTTAAPVTADSDTETDAEATGAEDAAALPGAVEDAVTPEDATRADVDAPADAEVSRLGGDYQEHVAAEPKTDVAAEPKTDDVEDPGGVEDTRDAETDEVETAVVAEDATTTATNALVSTNAVSVLAA